jgi:HSP20 family protein
MSPVRGSSIAVLALTLGTTVGLVAAAGNSLPFEPLPAKPQQTPEAAARPIAPVEKSSPPEAKAPVSSAKAPSRRKAPQPGIDKLQPFEDEAEAQTPVLPDSRHMMRGFMEEMRQMQALQESMHQRMRRFWEDSGFGRTDPFFDETPSPFSQRAKQRLDAMRRGRGNAAQASPFDGFFGGLPGGSLFGSRSSSAFFSSSNLSDDGDRLTYRLASPGLTKDQVKLQLGEDTLVVEIRSEQTEKRDEKGPEGQGWSEYARSSAMKHVIHLPAKIDPAGAKAEYTKEGLEITLPKAASGRTGNSLGL